MGIADVIYRSNIDGSNIEALLNTSIEVVGEYQLMAIFAVSYIILSILYNTFILILDDIAVDWIGNNLYWTDALHARIEVMDMDTRYRMELMRTGANTIPRAIAVDPSTR